METMYIKRGCPIIIGDTATGNKDEGVRFFGYSLKLAERVYREKHGLRGVHFRKKYVTHRYFGYIC